MLKNKKIILGVTGSIAAYKAVYLVRLLIKEGADVKVLMTPLAKEFVTPLTFATLSKNTVLTEFYNPENGDWNSHVDLGTWADAYIIAPATANTIAKMAHGIADNLLLTTYLSARCPVIVSPAMDLDMFKHNTTQKNIEILKSFGNHIIEPSVGELASGLTGKGRMEEPEIIIEKLKSLFSKKKLLNKRFLVTAGPTFEPIDPVRFIGNHSSGKMGYAIAESLANEGGDVTVISGPVSITTENKKINIINVSTAQQMYDIAVNEFKKCDCAVMCAAVSDFTPVKTRDQKIKQKNSISLELKATEDIAARLGEMKNKNQLLVGFALETNNEKENAKKKLIGKNLDFIVLNSLNDKGAGFQSDDNKISIIEKNGKVTEYKLKPKKEVAMDITGKIISLLIK